MNFFCFSGKNKTNTQNPTTTTAAASTSGTVAASTSGTVVASTSGTAAASTSGTASASTSTPKRKNRFKFTLNKKKKDVAATSGMRSRSLRIEGVSEDLREFSFNEIRTATKEFKLKNVLGHGGFGTVYKGKLSPNKQKVAIKILDPKSRQGKGEFITEVKTLGNAKHENLVQLIGYCAEENQMIIVYEYMKLGSLEKHLFDLPKEKKPVILSWNARMKIAFEAAKGLQYLHRLKPALIHRDLKCSNILLSDGYNAKLSDFGLARLGPNDDKTHVTTRIMGTPEFCAPDYFMTGHLSVKSDIYSFGVVLLELISGRRVVDETRPSNERKLIVWATPRLTDKGRYRELIDPNLENRYHNLGLFRAVDIASLCVKQKSHERPDIDRVIKVLKNVTAHPYVPESSIPCSPRLRKSDPQCSTSTASQKGKSIFK